MASDLQKRQALMANGEKQVQNAEQSGAAEQRVWIDFKAKLERN
jgi:hypothetical protein